MLTACSAQLMVPTTMQRVLEELERSTGLVATVILGGPEPQCGGKIIVMSFHSGQNELGHKFSEAYDGWSEKVLAPFTDYLGRVFSMFSFWNVLGTILTSIQLKMSANPAPCLALALQHFSLE